MLSSLVSMPFGQHCCGLQTSAVVHRSDQKGMTLFAIESGPLPLLGALFGLENAAAPLSELADEL